MGVQVKICGLAEPESAEAAVRAAADFGGLAFFTRSPRHVAANQARAVAAVLRDRVRIVGVFVNPNDAEIDAALEIAPLDLIQLHGSETPERVAAVGSHFGRPVIKAVPVADATDLARAHAYEEVADYLMFDAKAPVGSARPGGHGAAFDWQVLSGVRFRRPWFLAGGLDSENVGRAIRISGAPCVDASSGVEDAPGRKNVAKVAAFVQAAHAAPYAEHVAGHRV